MEAEIDHDPIGFEFRLNTPRRSRAIKAGVNESHRLFQVTILLHRLSQKGFPFLNENNSTYLQTRNSVYTFLES